MVKFKDETQTTVLFEFSSLSTGTGKIQSGSLNSRKTISLHKNQTDGPKGFITHKRGIKNKSMTISIIFRGADRYTNRDTFEALVDAQTTVYLDADSDPDFTRLEGKYDFDGSFRESIVPNRTAIINVVSLFENLNDA